jgi:hypothetical protein
MSLFPPTAALPIILACVKNGPADLGAPGTHVRRVMGPRQVGLAKRSFDGHRMAGDVCRQDPIGKIDVGVRALMNNGGELDAGHDRWHDPAY